MLLVTVTQLKLNFKIFINYLGKEQSRNSVIFTFHVQVQNLWIHRMVFVVPQSYNHWPCKICNVYYVELTSTAKKWCLTYRLKDPSSAHHTVLKKYENHILIKLFNVETAYAKIVTSVLIILNYNDNFLLQIQ